MIPSILSPHGQPRLIHVGVPVGTVVAYAGLIDEDPDQAKARRQVLAAQGWLVCDGSTFCQSEYPALATALGNSYGNAQDGQYFLPDYRGMFLRGVNGGRQGPDNDPGAAQRTGSGPGGQGNTGDNVGSLQTCQFQEHEHQYTAGTTPGAFEPGGSTGVASTVQSTTTAVVCASGDPASTQCFGAETRPLNLYVYYLIKATVDVIAVAPTPTPLRVGPGGIAPGNLLR